MRYGRLLIIIILCVAGGLFLWGVSVRAADGGTLPAASGSPSPSPTPTASLPPVVKPASAATVRWALKWRRAAVHVWAQWNRARDAFTLPAAPFHRHSARTPDRSEPGARWLDAGRSWKHDRGAYRARVAHLVRHMKHPGGTSSGVRWLPLARWVGWPSYALSQLSSIIMRESSGRERADNSSAHKGLLQFAWQWYRGRYLIHGHGRVFDPWDAEQTLTAARDVWEDQGHSFLPAWSLTAY